MVVMRGFNDDELPAFVRWTRDHANLEVRFIEYMPFDDNAWHSGKFVYTWCLDPLLSQHTVIYLSSSLYNAPRTQTACPPT